MVFKVNMSLFVLWSLKKGRLWLFPAQFIGSKSSSYYSRPKATSTEWACKVTHVTDLSWIPGSHGPVCIHLHDLKTPKALQVKNSQNLQTMRRNHQSTQTFSTLTWKCPLLSVFITVIVICRSPTVHRVANQMWGPIHHLPQIFW